MSGYGECEGCGNPMSDAEMFDGDLCERCQREEDELIAEHVYGEMYDDCEEAWL